MSLLPVPSEFERLARDGHAVPVWREYLADTLTPVAALRELLKTGRDAFLLESVVGRERVARYSFLGADPTLVFQARGPAIRLAGRDGAVAEAGGDPYARLEALLAERRVLPLPGLPRFTSGAVGCFGYDTVRYRERLPDGPPPTPDLPDIHLAFFDTVLVFDRVFNSLRIVSPAPAGGHAAAAARIDATARLLRGAGGEALGEPVPPAPPFAESSTASHRDGFLNAVARAQGYIRAGDIFQVVLSRRFDLPCAREPLDVYRSLRALNPSPYMFFLRLGDTHLIGSSPEILVRLEDGRAVVRPIAGTRPRGDDDEADRRLEEELRSDPKERAEHVMLVDLGRNDLGRVCVPGSVRIEELFGVERYSHVMHLVSEVTGRLLPGRTPLSLLGACLPAGTVSGAPKVRAMEIIQELEPCRRGIYGGAVGYLDFTGNMDTCIALRTIVLRNGVAHVQAGAGIVADSVPEREFEEVRSKARGLFGALGLP